MKSLLIFVGLIFFTFILWGAWAGLIPIVEHLGWSIGPDRLGQWGDSFGALNTLFGAFGFTAVILTLRMQSQTLRQQQEDQHRQRFDLTFFELLRLMRELQEKITFHYSERYQLARQKENTRKNTSKGIYNRLNISTQIKYTNHINFTKATGHTAIESSVRELRFWVEKNKDESTSLSKENLSDLYLNQVHNRSEATLGPYFRIIYTMLNRLREDKVLTPQEKARYGNLLRSQLTSLEITLAAFNGLAPVSKDFAALVTEFRLLKYMPEDTLREVFMRHYPAEAFNSRD